MRRFFFEIILAVDIVSKFLYWNANFIENMNVCYEKRRYLTDLQKLYKPSFYWSVNFTGHMEKKS